MFAKFQVCNRGGLLKCKERGQTSFFIFTFNLTKTFLNLINDLITICQFFHTIPFPQLQSLEIQSILIGSFWFKRSTQCQWWLKHDPIIDSNHAVQVDALLNLNIKLMEKIVTNSWPIQSATVKKESVVPSVMGSGATLGVVNPRKESAQIWIHR